MYSAITSSVTLPLLHTKYSRPPAGDVCAPATFILRLPLNAGVASAIQQSKGHARISSAAGCRVERHEDTYACEDVYAAGSVVNSNVKCARKTRRYSLEM
jgi:hypothetical protein